MTPCIVDADSLWARSYFAAAKIETAPGLEPESQHIAGIQLALQSVISLINPLNNKLPETVTHLLFCWDGPVAKKDKGRAPKSEFYLEGKKLLAEVFTAVFGAANAFPEGEADDAVATVATRLEKRSDIKTIYVVSGDKDLHQLASDKTAYYSLNDKSLLSWTHICNKWHIKHPRQMAIALAILGDSGDCIDGIKGWGPVKVAKLFDQVTPDMGLPELFELFKSQMKPDQVAKFEESLDLTLLLINIPNLPDPAPIVIGGLDLLDDMKWERLKQQVFMLQTSYDAGVKETVLDEN